MTAVHCSRPVRVAQRFSSSTCTCPRTPPSSLLSRRRSLPAPAPAARCNQAPGLCRSTRSAGAGSSTISVRHRISAPHYCSDIYGWVAHSKLCPECTSPDCKCDACWPGQNITHTPDKTCACFAKLDFCPTGIDPQWKDGEECPSCWPPENKACDCFAAIGFCEPPYRLPTTSRCKTLCPDCTSPQCKCDACWPGYNLTHTPDHTCECFAKLSFCNATKGEKPVYTPGEACPSCWPPENTACDCFAAVGFCKK